MKDAIAKSDAITDAVMLWYSDRPIPLHRPVFEGNERKYLKDCVDSNFVSSAGANVAAFEEEVASFCGARYAVATVNGTAALHASLICCGVERDTEVLSQALTFVATANSIGYAGATPIFIDVDRDTLSMSPEALSSWLKTNTDKHGDRLINVNSGAEIRACLPMHTFGLPGRIEEISSICAEYGVPLIEDAAEALGSFVRDLHTGTFGIASTLSFNGNKIITTGGGGMVITNDASLAHRLRHITTTAKVKHTYEFFHDELGYNYRLPNLNASLGLAQMEVLHEILKIKAEIASNYRQLCLENNITYIDGLNGTNPNYWLNAIVLNDREERELVLKRTNKAGVMTRPIWNLMTDLPMYQGCQSDGLENSKWLVDRVVNLPSSVPESEFHRLTQ